MFTFTREGSNLKVELFSELTPKANVYSFTWQCGDDCYADLLAKHFEKLLGDKLEKIRKESYIKGFKDAKAKRAKETWFSRWF
jgi:hypothetical protein